MPNKIYLIFRIIQVKIDNIECHSYRRTSKK